MPNLRYRRLRGDMIEVSKSSMASTIEMSQIVFLTQIKIQELGGTTKKLRKKYSELNIWKFSFTNIIVDISNSLSNEAIVAKTVKHVEINLDMYQEAHEFKYDHTPNINLTSKPGSDVKSRSNIVEEEVDIVVSASQRPQSNLTNLILDNIYMILQIMLIEATTLKLITIV